MAAKPSAPYLQKIRERIKSTLLVEALTDHVLGDREMKNSQVTAAVALLRKVIPDMAQVEHTGEIQHKYAMQVPAPSASVEEWQQQQTPRLQ